MVNDKWSVKIISGGQTGADRAALDFAMSHGFDSGGWIPKGRLAEDGPIPSSYTTLKETASGQYSERTKRNVEDSDGTLILTHGPLSGGSLLTYKIAKKLNKPCLHLDLHIDPIDSAARKAKIWIEDNRIETLNLAGTRTSGDPLIYDKTVDLLTLLFD